MDWKEPQMAELIPAYMAGDIAASQVVYAKLLDLIQYVIFQHNIQFDEYEVVEAECLMQITAALEQYDPGKGTYFAFLVSVISRSAIRYQQQVEKVSASLVPFEDYHSPVIQQDYSRRISRLQDTDELRAVFVGHLGDSKYRIPLIQMVDVLLSTPDLHSRRAFYRACREDGIRVPPSGVRARFWRKVENALKETKWHG